MLNRNLYLVWHPKDASFVARNILINLFLKPAGWLECYNIRRRKTIRRSRTVILSIAAIIINVLFIVVLNLDIYTDRMPLPDGLSRLSATQTHSPHSVRYSTERLISNRTFDFGKTNSLISVYVLAYLRDKIRLKNGKSQT